ncbi:MAG TPA: DAK2 domain-containing protein [Acidimicrobiia bacterium]|nr:DAK2 domain-containing protein [Acidimicrobiia bacterium]
MADETIRAQDLKQVMNRYLARLREHREALNRLNVYPVPDGDTGTNMTLTVESVVGAMNGVSSMSDVSQAMARGSLMGAQGNSGIILSQILRAWAEAFQQHREIGPVEVTDGLDRATSAAYQAVGRPVEGTILTVLRRAAEEAKQAPAGGENLGHLLERVYARAEQALIDTPELLPVLKAAGVVDAGGAGLLLLLACLREHVTGGKVALPPKIFRPAAQLVSGNGKPGGSIADLHYEVVFMLDGDASSVDQLKEAWGGVGESIVVVGGEGSWKCHIHTDDIGPVIEAGIAAGVVRQISVTNLLEQAAAEDFHRAGFGFEPLPEALEAKVGLIAVANGPGIVELFRQYGAQGMVVGGQTMNPSVGDLLKAVDEVRAKTVVVLPNNKNIISAAEELDRLTKKQVHVIPTRSVPQGIAAAVAYDTQTGLETVLSRMEKAARAVRSGEMTRAVREATTPVGDITQGDWIGLVEGKVQVIRRAGPGRANRWLTRVVGLVLGKRRAEARTRRLEQAAFSGALRSLLERLVDPEAEAITLVAGAGANADVTAAAVDWLKEYRSGIPVDVVNGGQPLYPYLVGVE